MKLIYLISALLLATPALSQADLPLPQLYTVVGVAEDDTLNVRESPSGRAADIGDLKPHETVEVLTISDDGQWGMVSAGENIGWVSTRFLSRTPNTTGDGGALPYGVPLRLSCYGAEPFWTADITSGTSISIMNYSDNSPTRKTYPMLGMAKPVNMGPYVYGFLSPPLSGVLRREYCDDGMSDTQAGWSIEILKARGNGMSMLVGCCQATLN